MGGQLFEGARRDVFYLLPEKVVVIGLDTDDGPEHPLWDPRIHLPVTEEDIVNVLTHGVQTPGLIRKEKLTGGASRAVVHQGRQRVKWSRAANARLREHLSGKELGAKLIRVPFLPKQELTEATAIIRANVAGNHFKASNYLMKAEEALRMKDRGMFLKDIAADFGVSEQAIAQWLQVLTLGEKSQSAVRAGIWAPSTAIQYADLSEEERDAVLADCVRLGVTISTSEAKQARAVRKQKHGKSNGHEVRRRIGAGMLRKILDHEKFDELDPVAQATIKCICGEANQDRRVKGLRTLLKDVGHIAKDED